MDALCRNDITAIGQLEHWKEFQNYWCEHKPSVTINVKEKEWPEVGAWVWNHFDEMSGVAFLPHSDHIYQQAPYEDATIQQLYEMNEVMPKNVDWDKLSEYESEDNTKASQELACQAGSCEI